MQKSYIFNYILISIVIKYGRLTRKLFVVASKNIHFFSLCINYIKYVTFYIKQRDTFPRVISAFVIAKIIYSRILYYFVFK